MKLILIIFFLQTNIVLGQIEGSCYKHSDPLSYNEFEKINFLDSTFEYRFINGLAGGTVKGNYILSGDTIIITSEYQKDNFKLEKSIDTNRNYQNVQLKIKEIQHSQAMEVFIVNKHNESQSINGKTIWHSKVDWFNEDIDTVITEYTIPSVNTKSDKLEVMIWRKKTTITIPLDSNFNTFILDLTMYPKELDYRFFNEKKALIIKNGLFFLDEKNAPEKTNFLIHSRKGITTSKKKKIKVFNKCT
jgi:hypothetical protein